MIQIPEQSFSMGDTLDGGLAIHPVALSAYSICEFPTSGKEYAEVLLWGKANKYPDINKGNSKAEGTHPIVDISWHDAVKWCNAKSEMESLTPCYYRDTGFRVPYRDGAVNLKAITVNWDANGYRLPTEAEWECAAKGGIESMRFPFGDQIDQTKANYFGLTDFSYDNGPNGFNEQWKTVKQPYTSPVDWGQKNLYGLVIAGNVREWCWDWYSSKYYPDSPLENPLGPDGGSQKVNRGGGWNTYAYYLRVADRSSRNMPTTRAASLGFRYVTRGGDGAVASESAASTDEPSVA
jgi:formylglycine-generating enzyme required for sulfatase activity